jgi:SAM-dependent methyltransferase
MTRNAAGHAQRYDTLFYEYQREGSKRSALAALPPIIKLLTINSVLDVGCGAGAWLAACRSLGVTDYVGVDGDYVDRSLLMIEPDRFLPGDISRPFDLGRQFDLVQCLEVGEHIPTAASATLVDNITRHGRYILFSAAVPGQGGADHINEQRYEYWRDLFAARDYRLFDFVRPRVQREDAIEPWYRYNLLFFCREDAIGALPKEVAATRVADGAPVADFSPTVDRLRKAMMRSLPVGAVSALAVLKHRLVVRRLNRK